MNQGNCIIAVSQDKNCKRLDNNYKNYCVECYQGFLAINGKCAIKNPVCKDIDQSNACTSCWPGYVLDSSTCVPEKAGATGGDIYCIKAGYNGACAQCSSGFYYSPTLYRCTELDPLCKDSNMSNGLCTSCYQGYQLTQAGKC